MGFGVPAGDAEPKDAGEPVRSMVFLADALDFRKPWAEDGLPRGLMDPPAAAPAGIGEGDHGFPASSASSFDRLQ